MKTNKHLLFFILFACTFMQTSISYAVIPANGIVTAAQIEAMTANEMWSNMVTPTVKVKGSKVVVFGTRKGLYPLITHADILNSLLGMINVQVAYNKMLDISLFVNPANPQISRQAIQAIREMNNANTFNTTSTNSVAIQGVNDLFPLVSSSAKNASNGMLNAANESAIPTVIFGTSNQFRSIVNTVQIQGAKNLNNSYVNFAAAGYSIYSNGFGGGAKTAGEANVLGSGQAGKSSSNISGATDAQIKQMLSQESLDPPTVCSCVTTYCTCLAGRVGMLLGYIKETKIQASQKKDLDDALVEFSDKIVNAIDGSAEKVKTVIKKSKQLTIQQEKAIFDKREKDSHAALVKSDMLTKVKHKVSVTDKAEKSRNKFVETQMSELVDKKVSGVSAKVKADLGRSLVSNHNDNYCSESDSKNKYCSTDWNSSYTKMMNADIRMSNFFINQYSSKQEVASSVFIDNIINNEGLQLSIIPIKTFKDSDHAKQLRASQLEVLAYSSIPIYILNDIKSTRIPVKGLGKSLDMGFLGFGDDVSLIDAYMFRSGLQETSLLDDIKNFFSFKFPYEIKMIEAKNFTNEMLVRNYKLKSKLSVQFAAINASKLKSSNDSLKRVIDKLE